MLTDRPTALPDFALLGAQKAGTTSMFHLLRQHHDIKLPRTKETHYFDQNYPLGIEWYSQHFPEASDLKEGDIVGDATPCYIFNPLVPERLTNLLPNVKCIVLIRDPVGRAISHYFHCVRKGYEPLPPEQAFDVEEERLAGELTRMKENPSYYSFPLRMFSYAARGLYASQISNWLQYISLDRFLFIRSDDFDRSPEAEFTRVCDFLGVPPIAIPEFTRRNIGAYSSAIPNSLLRRLADRFHEPNQELAKLLGSAFDFNLRPGEDVLRLMAA